MLISFGLGFDKAGFEVGWPSTIFPDKCTCILSLLLGRKRSAGLFATAGRKYHNVMLFVSRGVHRKQKTAVLISVGFGIDVVVFDFFWFSFF